MKWTKKIKGNLRVWALRKLRGVSKEAFDDFSRGCESFAGKFMESNGHAAIVVTKSNTVLRDIYIENEKAKVGIAVAPWANNVFLDSCTIKVGEG